jgi:xanthine dehydrogenase accessory factor
MDSVDLQVLESALAWKKAGHTVTFFTVIETWGSSPRPPGAMLSIRGDGQIVGSVSGGCVEDDLIIRAKKSELVTALPEIVSYGVSTDEAARFGLPCGGAIKLLQEPLRDTAWLEELLVRHKRHELSARTVTFATGAVALAPTTRADVLELTATHLKTIHGPRWRLLVIGAGQLSVYLAQMAQALDYSVTVCDPREEYANEWMVPNTTLDRGMPDDVVVKLNLDAHSAVVAVTHDPKLDDMALMEALKSPAFYVGALGSRVNTEKRKVRLKEFDLAESEISRLHGPIGLRIGSRTPPEIAVSILAEITAVKNKYPLDKVNDKAVSNFAVAGEPSACAVSR